MGQRLNQDSFSEAAPVPKGMGGQLLSQPTSVETVCSQNQTEVPGLCTEQALTRDRTLK